MLTFLPYVPFLTFLPLLLQILFQPFLPLDSLYTKVTLTLCLHPMGTSHRGKATPKVTPYLGKLCHSSMLQFLQKQIQRARLAIDTTLGQDPKRCVHQQSRYVFMHPVLWDLRQNYQLKSDQLHTHSFRKESKGTKSSLLAGCDCPREHRLVKPCYSS